MKTVSAGALAKAYASLYPDESRPGQESELERILGNWLDRYKATPAAAIGLSNWGGKVTKSLFMALGEVQPKTKAGMLRVLSGCSAKTDKVLTIKEAIQVHGLEYLRGKQITDGARALYIHDCDLDSAIALWADEPENAHLNRRFYGAETRNDPMGCVWIYSSYQLVSNQP